ncbi:MAG: DUF4173 domain-containing protein [Clostridiales Family XIII bacterium]|jgi:hypothetical protein|nr:DUF4173 domain-containing protein [Clostridiales Family XIII bacterium]
MNDSAATDNFADNLAANRVNPYYVAPPARRDWVFAPGDAMFAVFAFLLGMLFWDWIILVSGPGPGISATLFFFVAAALTGVYLHLLGFKQNRRSIPALAALLAGAIPFTLYGGLEIHQFLMLFEFAAALAWIMNTCGRSVTDRLSGYILYDAVNQIFAVPFANFPGPFKALAQRAKNGGGSRRRLYAFIGILASIPVIAGVVALLISADKGFAYLMENFAEAVNLETFGTYLLKLIVGIPVACYIYGSAFGNAHGRHADAVTKTGADATLATARKLPLAAVRPGLILLVVIYAVFFIAMGAYLFSAFGGGLPSSYTYAEYARRGFFELCGVAAINLVVIAFVYLFAKRGKGEYPKSLRALTATISAMTVLLILTAASKMLLYVETYGLTRLRVYTLWFMALLLCVFAVVVIWHVRPINAGKPIVIVFALLTLGLFFTNTDGLIAKYNVERYEAGALNTVDTETLAYMSDAVTPYLVDLKENAPDYEVRVGAKKALYMRENSDVASAEESSWRNWNLQSGLSAG